MPPRGEFKLLNPYSRTTATPIEEFVSADAFREGNRIGGYTLTAIGMNFSDHFLAIVERNVPEVTLKGWTLLHTAGDTSIIESLGGEKNAPLSFLAYVYHLMETGEDGPCHVNWQSNFAYLRSPINRRLWAIHWSMNYEHEWTMGAVLVPHPYVGWPPGARLFGG